MSEQSNMSEPPHNRWDAKGRLQSFFWYVVVVLCASTIIASSLFNVFLNLVIRGEGTIGPSDLPFVWVIPLLTSLAAGGAMGSVNKAVKVALPVIFFSIIITVTLSSLPVVLGVITSVAASNQFLMAAISTDFYVFILMVFTILFGLIIGAMFGGKGGQ